VLQRSQLPGDLLRSLRRHGIMGVAGVPPVWSLLLRNEKSLEEAPLTTLRYITNSGGRIPQANLDRLRRVLPGTKIFLMYGLTEAFRSTFLPPDEIDRGSECIGKPIPNTEILVIKDGRAAEPGEVGELVHRGPTVALGYWGNAAETERRYRPNPLAPPELLDVERVVYSGDLVRRDEEGYLYFVGRNDAMIKSGGFRISPEEVENLLIASGLVRVFRRLYELRFPIRHMRLADMYGPRDGRPADGDVTGSFRCRQAVPSPCTGGSANGSWSNHAYGHAIDLNPVENPYVGCGRTRDPLSAPYLDRSRLRKGMVTPAVIAAFRSIGWGWGGSWSGSVRDYQHFSFNGR